MQCRLHRSELIKPLQWVCGGMSRIMGSHQNRLLLQVQGNKLCFTGCDSSVELKATATLSEAMNAGEVAVSARKLLDICRMLPEQSCLTLEHLPSSSQLELTAPSIRAQLATADATTVPSLGQFEAKGRLTLAVAPFQALLQSIAFAMAQQDVRHYLNGMLLEYHGGGLKAVASDGHRMAFGSLTLGTDESGEGAPCQLLIPRKSALEITRFLELCSSPYVTVSFGEQTLALEGEEAWFTTQLLPGQFPSYEGALQAPLPHHFQLATSELRHALLRAMIFVQEKPRKVRLFLTPGSLRLTASNHFQEEFEETLPLEGYQGEAMEVGFDAAYLLDGVNAVKEETLRCSFRNPSSLFKFKGLLQGGEEHFEYIVMPMLL